MPINHFSTSTLTKLGAPVRNRTCFSCLQNRTSSIKGFKGKNLVAGDGNAPSSTSAYETERYLLQPALNLVDRERIELSISGCKPDVFPLALTAQIILKQTNPRSFEPSK